MNLLIVDKVYFIGIGGIGMSALARYFHANGKQVGGYDRTETALTKELAAEGIEVHYEDGQMPDWITSAHHEKSLIVYTPAVPETNKELQYFREHNFHVHKRSEVLGFITQDAFTIAVAGTHGKTTTSTILAHVLRSCGIDCTAFLGGLSANYNSNLLLAEKGNVVVVEADEYDRSFLKLSPDIAIITSVDADHMDIYQNEEDIHDTFLAFSKRLKQKGLLIVNKHIGLPFEAPENGGLLTYSADVKADYMAKNVRVEEGRQLFDAQMLDLLPGEVYEKRLKGLNFCLPGRHNVENALAAMAVACHQGAQCEQIKEAIASFQGVKRRYERQLEGERVYIDDYAHHPAEIAATIKATRMLYPEHKMTVVFQPHLFSRTRDFADAFAQALSLADELFLLEIYPAREEPIAGVNSQMLLAKVSIEQKQVISKEDLLKEIEKSPRELLLTLGAGDIDRLVEPLKERMS
jgi:UDP-N-acetylmuramate--alanine ligase